MPNLKPLPGSSPVGARDGVSWSEPSIRCRPGPSGGNRTAHRQPPEKDGACDAVPESLLRPQFIPYRISRWQRSDPPVASITGRTPARRLPVELTRLPPNKGASYPGNPVRPRGNAPLVGVTPRALLVRHVKLSLPLPGFRRPHRRIPLDRVRDRPPGADPCGPPARRRRLSRHRSLGPRSPSVSRAKARGVAPSGMTCGLLARLRLGEECRPQLSN